jgi:hypothetical protein
MDTKIDFSGTFLLPLSENAVADSGNRSKVAGFLLLFPL